MSFAYSPLSEAYFFASRFNSRSNVRPVLTGVRHGHNSASSSSAGRPSYFPALIARKSLADALRLAMTSSRESPSPPRSATRTKSKFLRSSIRKSYLRGTTSSTTRCRDCRLRNFVLSSVGVSIRCPIIRFSRFPVNDRDLTRGEKENSRKRTQGAQRKISVFLAFFCG